MADEFDKQDLFGLTADVVSAYASSNKVPASELPQIIRDVYATFAELGQDGAVRIKGEPAVPVDKSITPTHLICLEDGKKLKMLKRHLKTAYDMTPEEYRERWGLPADYPMVAPSYAKKRSSLAKQIGLGRKSAGRPKKK